MARHEETPVPTLASLKEVYGEGSQLEEAQLRFGNLKSKFIQVFGHAPDVYARSPGEWFLFFSLVWLPRKTKLTIRKFSEFSFLQLVDDFESEIISTECSDFFFFNYMTVDGENGRLRIDFVWARRVDCEGYFSPVCICLGTEKLREKKTRKSSWHFC